MRDTRLHRQPKRVPGWRPPPQHPPGRMAGATRSPHAQVPPRRVARARCGGRRPGLPAGAAPALDRRAEGRALAGRERARLAGGHRAQGDDSDARRRPDRRGHLPPEGRLEEVPDHLGAHALQLQLLGRGQRRPPQHDRRAHRRQAGVHVRRDAGARPVLRGRRVGRPRHAAQRRRRRGHVDDVPALVQRQGRHHRLFLHGRVAAGGRRAGQPGLRGVQRAGVRLRRRSDRPVLRAGELVPRRRLHDVQPHLVLRQPEAAAPDLPVRHQPGRPDPPVQVLGPGGTPAGGGLVEEGVLASSPCRTSSSSSTG